ncbi:PREDICTED: RCC1 domain-containing protein 1, partial [Condylura cristata]|uniref:RCC1 domain-containing protein 1 n=1 Tax=Condylura cristata TaxID=143302 RepID=UPI0003346895
AEHALLLGAGGQVFSWGAGRLGQLGHSSLEAEPAPRPVEALQGLPVVRLAAGGWHSACLSEAGDVYIWGWNESGQLALPARSLAQGGKAFEGAAPGPDGDGPEVAAQAGAEAGAPFIAVQPFPALLDLPLGADAREVSCGSRHTAVVTSSGQLYTWGWGKYGQLGLGDTASRDRPCRVDYFVDSRLQVRAVHCGPWNTYVCTVAQPQR